jgi:hypothetical protein
LAPAGSSPITGTLAISGLVHAYLYVHGYRYVATIGTSFAAQAGIFCALAVLILAGGPLWLRRAGGALSLPALVAFALSRTNGLPGFTQHGWQPPFGPVGVISEVLIVCCLRPISSAGSARPQQSNRAGSPDRWWRPRQTLLHQRWATETFVVTRCFSPDRDGSERPMGQWPRGQDFKRSRPQWISTKSSASWRVPALGPTAAVPSALWAAAERSGWWVAVAEQYDSGTLL